jgi:hypothetical protein
MTGDSTPANVPPATKVVPDDSAPADNAVPTAKATPAASVAGSDDPKPLAQGGASGPVELAANDPGFIEITVSKPATKTHGGSDTTGDADSGVALAKVAANEFQLKRYDAAAKAYEKLLTSGGNPATLNQRLGQCYENLGRNQDALTAYQRAADALSSAIAAGHGNLTSEKTALNSCKAAIQLLGGGQ